ncbi:hypothetical protein [Myxococcus sp. RHSTA-1-4]|uniref:hypothetical protein n=1 Tax=Myxococcus sp. RHSTA-1-4 TaxID=2874601 RepID=UPI001CECCB0F|nr:hypothetical protein [Myxococcus sp. RHSTA-1-4]
MGRAPVGVAVTGVRRVRALVVKVREAVVSGVEALAAGVALVARVEEMAAVAAARAVAGETVTRGPSAPASVSSPS